MIKDSTFSTRGADDACHSSGQPDYRSTTDTNDRQPSSIGSSLYVGKVRHHRLHPVEHRFEYSLFMVLIDLGEVDRFFGRNLLCSQNKWSPIQFRRSDYLGDPSQPLLDCVRNFVLHETGRAIEGPVRLLTHLRYLGFVFNPVSFYYCYAADGMTLQAIVADVTNTPWGERYAYAIPWQESSQVTTYSCDKAFHVSPFMSMDQRYGWEITLPSERLSVSIQNFENQVKIFTARLDLNRQPLTHSRLVAQILRFPWVTIKVAAAIYWQAFRLWLKRVPFVPHPQRQARR